MARIGIDASRAFGRRRTGTESYSYNLTRELIRQNNRRHDLTLYLNALPSAGDPLLEGSNPESGVDLRHIPFPRLWTHLRLSAEMLTRPPDLLFVPAHVLPIVRPKRTVVTVHDLGYLYWPQAHPKKRWLYLHASTDFNARVATIVLADSEATKDDLIRHYRTPEEKIRVIHLGHGSEYYPRSQAKTLPTLQRHGLTPGGYFLAIGTLQPRKNYPRLIEAFSAARSSLPEGTRLVIVGGDGFGAEAVHRAAKESGESVRLLGYLPASDLPDLLAGARALVFPSLYEGFGLPALEAMASGTPVIAANASSLPEVVGNAALLVDPTDTKAISQAIVRLGSDEELWASLRADGIVRARGFSWTECGRKTFTAIEEALGR